jgi:hypothetical protein
MARAPLTNIRFFTLSQIADLWYRELGLRQEQLLYELRAGVIGVKLRQNGQPLPQNMIPEEALPPHSERVDRNWIYQFAEKQGWQPPSFLSITPETARAVGRPSNRNEVIRVFQQRQRQRQTEDTIAAEARAIRNQLRSEDNISDIPQTKTIQKHIRREFNVTSQSRSTSLEEDT